MPASFVALPVGQGDAFLAQDVHYTTLIDGGRSRATLPELLSEEVIRELNVVACTHNDSDHAEGLIGLFKNPKIEVHQVWLPGQWTTRLGDLLISPEAFMIETLRDIESLREEDLKPSLADLVDNYENPETPSADGPAIAEVLDHAIEARADRPSRFLRHLALSWAGWFCPFHGLRCGLFWQALDAAERIRQLAYLAWDKAAVVRWFDIAALPTTTNGPLSPVNAGEIKRVSPGRPGALQFLALSVSNRMSLCFEFRPRSGNAAVLLTADSDLKFKAPIEWTKGMIVTAPHHGSKANANAYERARKDSPSFYQSFLWVRSDGRFRSRPGGSFLQQTRRYCTRCRPYDQKEQACRFTATADGWKAKQTRPCRCVKDKGDIPPG